MTKISKTLAKGGLGIVALAAMALAGATPAMADDYNDGIGVGEVIAGAVIIGGIAALAGAFDGDDDRRYNRDYRDRGHDRGYDRSYDRGYNRGFGPREAVNRCINAAENQARRFGGYRFANVTQVHDVDRTRGGFRVEGRIEVERNRGYRGRDFDRGRFSCYFDGNGRPFVDFDGIRGLR